ncbi:unnamed protein product [Pedinophyceae sp. YPF-701]|nr:unnamed protein product [Pedinophyceae sp. YPF-701]
MDASAAAARRVNGLVGHLQGQGALVGPAGDSPDDIVVVAALRTPMTKARRGGLKDVPPEELMSAVLKAVLDRTSVRGEEVGDIVVGSVLGSGSQRATEVRMGGFLAGLPETVPVRLVNRQCSSGLQAIADVAASIKAGYYDIGIAGGIETMSINPMDWKGDISPASVMHEQARSCLLPMGITSENVAARWGIDRDTMDAFAATSHAKAAAAQASGRFAAEIVPVRGLDKDDGIRAGTTPESLAKLKPAFMPKGTTTAGNASQVTDGAAAVLLMRRSEAQRRGLKVLGVLRSFAVVGCDPAVMGIGPAVAIPEAVKRAGIAISDLDVVELNEAFASQATYCINKLGLDPAKVNPNGGAIALGHPLGCTGARCTATLLHEMAKRPGARYGAVSMCIGTGMGAAAVFEVPSA